MSGSPTQAFYSLRGPNWLLCRIRIDAGSIRCRKEIFRPYHVCLVAMGYKQETSSLEFLLVFHNAVRGNADGGQRPYKGGSASEDQGAFKARYDPSGEQDGPHAGDK